MYFITFKKFPQGNISCFLREAFPSTILLAFGPSTTCNSPPGHSDHQRVKAAQLLCEPLHQGRYDFTALPSTQWALRPLTFIPSSFPLSINSSILFLSSDWVRRKEKMRRASALSPRPFQEPRPPAGHLQLASRALVPKDAQAPKPPSFPQCPSEAGHSPPGV